MYDSAGRMTLQIMQRDRTSFATEDRRQSTSEEVKAAFESYYGSFGRYAVSMTEGVVTHYLDGCSFPNRTGSTQKRFMKIEGNRLSLMTPPMRVDGKEVQNFLTWERLE